MINHKKSIILTCLLSLAALIAQGNQPQVNIKFRALAINYPHSSAIYMQPDGGTPMRIYPNSRTGWIDYSGPNPITFYTESLNSKKEKVRTPIGSVNVSNAPKAPLLVFSKSDSDSKQCIINILDDSLETSPVGSYRIFNFTTKQIAGMIDNQKFLLDPKATAYARVANPKDFEVTVKLAETSEGKAKHLYASTWTFSENFRYLVLITPSDDRTRGNIDIRLIPDLILEEQG